MISRHSVVRPRLIVLVALLVGFSPIIHNNVANRVVAGSHTMVRASSSPTGRSVAVGAHPYAIAVDERVGRAYVVSLGSTRKTQYPLVGLGTLTVIDTATERVIAITRLGTLRYLGGDFEPSSILPTQAMAIDERTGRIFVLNSGKADAEGRPLSVGSVIVLDTRGRIVQVTAVDRSPVAILVDEGSGHAFVSNGTAAGTLSVLDAANGRVQHTVPVGAYPGQMASGVHGHLIAMTHAGTVTINAITGATMATTHLNNVPCAMAIDQRAGHVFIGTGVSRGTPLPIYRLDAGTGKVIGRTVIPDQAISSPQACLLAVNESANRLLAFHPPQYDMNGPATASLLDTHTGRRLCTIGLPSDVQSYVMPSLAVDERRGYFLVSLGTDRQMRVLDARTGTVVQTARVGRGPQVMAVDERRGRVFVANVGDGTVSIFDERSGKTS